MNKKEWEDCGYHFIRGVFMYVGKVVIITVLILVFYGVVIQKTDDTDFSRWKRSGLRIHTDAKTGQQYLSNGRGLTPRLGYQAKGG